jgi:hypothetical protein
MFRKRPVDEMIEVNEIVDNDELVELRLPAQERRLIISSGHVVDSLLDRIRLAPARENVQFTFEELEDLHRGLTFDAEHTDDKKRGKILRRVLRKIDELLAEDDEFEDDDDESDEFDPDFGEWNESDEEPDLPTDALELLESMFGSPGSVFEGTPPPCQIKLTAAHRATLRGMETVPADTHKLLAVESADDLEFAFSPRQVLVASLAIREAIELSSDKDSAQPFWEVAQRISEGIFAALEETAGQDAEDEYRQSQRAPAKVAYQLKITLEGSKPPIWRRVLVADCTLGVLHDIVQTAMGWENEHLHQFEFGKESFGDPEHDLDTDYDETRVLLSELVANGCQKLRYWYDFGDDWWHTIQIEETLEPQPTDKFPLCVKGVGACPPEDCGGIWGYYEYLEAISNPKHKRHAELIEWAGEGFDANYFDVDEVNQMLAAPANSQLD